jgi:hypothetical protein
LTLVPGYSTPLVTSMMSSDIGRGQF